MIHGSSPYSREGSRNAGSLPVIADGVQRGWRTAFSPDGKWIAYHRMNPVKSRSMYGNFRDLEANGRSRPLEFAAALAAGREELFYLSDITM